MSASRPIAETVVGSVRISTVEIPSHRAVGLLPYETMIFGGQRDEECWRDATQGEAEQRHHDLVAVLLYEQFVTRMRELAEPGGPVEDWLIDNALEDLDAGLAELGIVQDVDTTPEKE